MLRNFILICALGMAQTAFALFVDKIHDDYKEESNSKLHSYGLMVYGSHNNTFHLRQFFIRYNHQFGENVQFFATLNGGKDTHAPEINYPFQLGNVNLYDYGITLRFLKNFFVSPRGAATYRANYHTYLLIPPYFFDNNAAEFDSPNQFLPIFLTGPGIRVGYTSENLDIGYSQGDFRHSIPMAFMAKWKQDNYYVRALAQLENEDPTVYNDALWKAHVQLSVGLSLPLTKKIGFSGIAEVSRIKNDWWGRLEQAFHYGKYTLGIREVVKTDEHLLFEFSLMRNLLDFATIGIYVATDKRAYFATQIQF